MASPTIGWIGLGSMGLPMATNLQKHLSATQQPALYYHNRTLSRGDPLRALGAQPCPCVVELVTAADLIFLSLADDAALDATLHRMDVADLAGKLVVDTSTVHPDSSARAREYLVAKGARFVAAPVFGASPVAAAGQLLWVIAGPEADVKVFEPYVVGVMGRGIIRLGEDVRQASLLKTAGNLVTASMMQVVAESHLFAEKTGLGSAPMEALLEQQYGPLALSMSRRLTTGAYVPERGARPWSDLNLALKDIGHGVSCAEAAGAQLQVAGVAKANLEEAKKHADAEGRALDSSSMYGVLRTRAGLPFETELVQNRDREQEQEQEQKQ